MGKPGFESVRETDDDLEFFCWTCGLILSPESLFSYQYVKQRTEITDGIKEWLYEHASENISVVASLVHDAQEIAILNTDSPGTGQPLHERCCTS